MKYVLIPIVLLSFAVMVGCPTASETVDGGNCFFEWNPTEEMLAANPDLQTYRAYHAESMQLGSYVSTVYEQYGDEQPELIKESITTQAGPVNAALGAGGLIGASVLFNPDADNTNVQQEGGGASANASASAKAKAKAKVKNKNHNRNYNKNTNINKGPLDD